MNKVVDVTLNGGLIGLLFDSPASKLQRVINEYNNAGWKVTQIIPSETGNILIFIGRFLLLLCTLFLYTSTNGFYVIFEATDIPAGNGTGSGGVVPKCPSCAKGVQQDDAYCEHCGTKLK